MFSQSEETRQQDGLPHPKVSYDDDKFQISLDAKDYKSVSIQILTLDSSHYRFAHLCRNTISINNVNGSGCDIKTVSAQ